MDDTPTVENAPTEHPEEDAQLSELARKGGIVLALIVAALSLFVALTAVSDAIRVWLEPRWVPIWRAIFALAVAGVALWTVRRLS